MKLYEITALCRSGHHAVMNWIIKNMTGIQCTWKYKMNFLDNGVNVLSEANHDIPLSYKFIEESASTTKLLLVGYEDAPWDYTIFSEDNKYKGRFSLTKYGNFEYEGKVVIIRDFYTNLSSRLKSNQNKLFEKWNDNKVHQFNVDYEYIRRWKNLANACLNQKVNYIKFEDWVKNPTTRNNFLIKTFGIEPIYDIQGIFGTKSSFGETKNVLERDKMIEIPEEIKNLIRKDNELHYLIGALGYEYKEI